MEKEVDISLFFNHDLETGKTIIGYPKVIYHYIGGRFYLTGINEGSFAVQQLANSYKKPFEENGILFSGFKPVETVNMEDMVLSGQTYRYRLWKWIPFHRKDYGNFGQLPLAEKAVSLNQKLLKHISQDLARYLGLETTGLQAEIIQILKTHTRPVFYEGNPYYGFDIEFESNMQLPRFTTLGNIKSLGYGRIEPV